ncbi:MAG: hypothetical protein ACUVQ1_09005 [Candidatus Kapaibacteriales bacterium]
MKILSIRLMCFLLFQSEFVFSRGCCSFSVPTLSTIETPLINFGLLRSSLSYLLTNTSSFYLGKDKTTDPPSPKASSHNLSLNLDFGILHNLNISLFFPFNSLYRKSSF